MLKLSKLEAHEMGEAVSEVSQSTPEFVQLKFVPFISGSEMATSWTIAGKAWFF